jgi:hypothetical protein
VHQHHSLFAIHSLFFADDERHSLPGGGGTSTAGGGDAGAEDAKRQKRLALNRKAAKESRRRKKARIQELQKAVVHLRKENGDLREQNSLLKQMMDSDMPSENSMIAEEYKRENAQLRLSLYENARLLVSPGAVPSSS